jgi:hypothetical protein
LRVFNGDGEHAFGVLAAAIGGMLSGWKLLLLCWNCC